MADRIAEALRDAIIAGTLEPGSRVNESEIAARYRISRSPVREALRLLQQEGLIAMEPRRGAFVKRLTPQEVVDVYDVKSVLEGRATGLATRRMTESEIDSLAACVARMEREVAAGDMTAYVDSTRQFHEIIVRGAGNATLASIYQGLERKIHWLRTLSLSRPGRVEVSLADHRAILDAMRQRDARRAEALAHAHIEQAGQDLLPRLERMVGDARRLALDVTNPNVRPR
ncbi:MAG TPA: GntR family transcriptional regulator [Thermodesulfobacteriota bacterium]